MVTATIRKFVKGPKNAHTFAAHVYEKGPQILTDAISELEKLQAAQQLTATLLPSSTVIVMSHEGDQCFQCQELGHIIHHCLNVCCFECNEYGHVVAHCSDRIYHHACLDTIRDNTLTQGIMPDQPLDTTARTGTDIAGWDHSHTLMDIEATVTIIHAEVIPDHITDATTGALHDTITPVLITIAVTHHTGDHPHVEVYLPIPEITAGPDHACHKNQVRTPHLNPHPVPTVQQWNPWIRSTGRSQWMTLSQTITALITPLVTLKMI